MDSPSSIMLGLFRDPHEILRAANEAREKGWKDLDAITPHAIHGMDHALGLKKSWVPWVTLVAGLAGAVGGYELQAWTLAVDWPINIGGKPFVSWPAFIPITFECGILAGGIATFIAMWIACRLPNKKPRMIDARLTDDQYGLVVPLAAGMHEQEIATFMKGAGADEVRRMDL